MKLEEQRKKLKDKAEAVDNKMVVAREDGEELVIKSWSRSFPTFP